MSTQRVLVLCHDAQRISSSIKSLSLKDADFSVFQDWESSVSALGEESFSAIVAWKIVSSDSVAAFVSRITQLAPKTPIILVAPGNEGQVVLDALKSGVSEVLFEETIDSSFTPTLEKYLFSKSAFLRRMSINELLDFCVPIITTTEINLLATTVIEKFREAIDVSFGVFFKEGGKNDEPYTIYSSSGFTDEDATMSFLRRFGKSLIRNAVSVPTVIPVEKIKGSSSARPRPLEACRFLIPVWFELESGLKMYLAIGLPGALESDAINNLGFLCRHAHLSLINSERSEQMKSLIYIDDVTKLYNIRYLNVVIDREIKRSERHQNTFSVLFMDIDFFKRVNDTHGHLVGSRVLHEIGAVLKSCVRDSDTVVRYGGDEFVVLLVDTNSEEALFVAERMRKSVEQEQLVRLMGINVRLTVSIGVASFPEHAVTKQQLLTLADQAMYRGKESTRNVVYVALSKTPC